MPGSRSRADRRRWRVAPVVLALAFLAPPAAAAQTAPAAPVFRLEQNFPNPFTPGVSPTIFTYVLEAESPVRLTVYNLLAQEVAVLVDERQTRGLHRVAWDGTDTRGEAVPAGVYWYKLEAGEQSALRRLRVRDRAETGITLAETERQRIWYRSRPQLSQVVGSPISSSSDNRAIGNRTKHP